ncbi:MAG: CPBP family intramembrane glutamic endopeptidase [Candidatus Omnitrophota bacterium]
MIRGAYANNKFYVWLIVGILLIQAHGIFIHAQDPKQSLKARPQKAQSFKQQLDEDKGLFEKALAENPKIATRFAYICFIVFVLFVLGIIFLATFIVNKAKGKDLIPKMLDEDPALWSWKDAVKIVIIFLFFNHLVFALGNVLAGFFNKPLLDERLSMILDTTLMDMLMLIVVIYFVSVKYKQKITALGISLKAVAKNIGVAVYGYLAFLPVLAATFLCVVFIAKLLNYMPQPQPIYELIFKERRFSVLMVVSVMAAFIGPVIEEIFFRGFLYPALKKTLSAAASIIITALIFSALHTNIIGFFPILGLGIFLAYLREKTGSLIPSIIVHITHNAALASIMFFVKSVMAQAG